MTRHRHPIPCAVFADPPSIAPGLLLDVVGEQLVTLGLGHIAGCLRSPDLDLLHECRHVVEVLRAVQYSHGAAGAYAWERRARECREHLEAFVEGVERRAAS